MKYNQKNLAGTSPTTSLAQIQPPPTVSTIRVDSKTGKGSLAVKLNFYAWADDNHMPLKKITIDWGDGQSIVSGGPESYYQNRKLECRERCDNPGEENDGNICSKIAPCNGGICRLQFGDSKDACEDKPFEFSHVYGCSAGQLELLDACVFIDDDPNKPILNSPCEHNDDCYFRPKVQVLDNWGWCNGECDNPNNLDGVGCYEGEWECKSGTDLTVNDDSYTYYNGNIIVAP